MAVILFIFCFFTLQLDLTLMTIKYFESDIEVYSVFVRTEVIVMQRPGAVCIKPLRIKFLA